MSHLLIGAQKWTVNGPKERTRRFRLQLQELRLYGAAGEALGLRELQPRNEGQELLQRDGLLALQGLGGELFRPVREDKPRAFKCCTGLAR